MKKLMLMALLTIITTTAWSSEHTDILPMLNCRRKLQQEAYASYQQFGTQYANLAEVRNFSVSSGSGVSGLPLPGQENRETFSISYSYEIQFKGAAGPQLFVGSTTAFLDNCETIVSTGSTVDAYIPHP